LGGSLQLVTGSKCARIALPQTEAKFCPGRSKLAQSGFRAGLGSGGLAQCREIWDQRVRVGYPLAHCH
jgi:hypothetical protein